MKLYIDEITVGELLRAILYLPRFFAMTVRELRWDWYFYKYEIATPLDFDTEHKRKGLEESRKRQKLFSIKDKRGRK